MHLYQNLGYHFVNFIFSENSDRIGFNSNCESLPLVFFNFRMQPHHWLILITEISLNIHQFQDQKMVLPLVNFLNLIFRDYTDTKR